ncbi:MAG: SRPBCC domain-containing protein [Bdellovibrionota bacterium]
MFDLKIEKIIAKDVKEVFQSLKAGKLFMNCSADSNTIQIDFRVGGKYKLDFKSHKVSNWGEFLEIVPDKKIVFSWCQTFGLDQKPDTTVTIELFPDGTKTKLVLQHSGFKDQAQCDNHYQGWIGGLTDLSTEMEKGSVRLVRRYDLPVEKLFALVKSGNLFGDMHDVVQDQKILIGSDVSLSFLVREEGKSALEITQAGLTSDAAVIASRKHWDLVTNKLGEMIG